MGEIMILLIFSIIRIIIIISKISGSLIFIFITLSVAEASIGVSLLTIMVRRNGNDYIKSQYFRIIRIVFFCHIVFISVIFYLSHPIRLSILLIIIIILVFLGGVIILIIYISTLAANEKFRIVKLSPENMRFTILIRLTLFILLKYKNIINYTRLNNTAVGILYESSNFTLLLCLIVYLLLTLVCVVKLVKFESGPLIKRL